MTTPVRTPNRLIKEKSPYLLQHAHNPVAWYPWGDEALHRAESEDKPVFLSIGYSTCHWCHAMARESFEDKEVAGLLNSRFIAVKVDREERPDIDHVYMNVCQMLTGSGGWPLTIIMTPDKRPFFAGTYFPERRRFGMPGLIDVLEVIAAAWSHDRKALLEQADKVCAALRREAAQAGKIPGGGPSLNRAGLRAQESDRYRKLLDRAYQELSKSFDEDNGGFGTAPKFPAAHNLLFLLRYWKRTGEKRALEMVERTLQRAYSGGIYDHVGFGFFRYSTDARWIVPHFEKMLYDNAMMMMAYTELGAATKKDAYRDVVYQLYRFLESEMKSPEGAFWSAVDAESEGEEGKFYVWTPDEVMEVLGDEAEAYCKMLGITADGNFHGKSVPNLIRPVEKRGRHDRTEAVPEGFMAFEKLREKLYAHRSRRVHPAIDDKVLTSWNALTVAALATAAQVFDDPDFLDSAHKCLEFLERTLVKDGHVFARYRDGEVLCPGYLDDYAFLVWAYIEMHQATQEPGCLARAVDLAERMVDLFWDNDKKGFFLTSEGSETLIVRPKEVRDGALPSGNSVAVMDLLRLAYLLGREDFEERGFETVDGLMDLMTREPTGMMHLVTAVEFVQDMTMTRKTT